MTCTTEPAALYDQAFTAYRNGTLPEARSLLGRLLVARPDDARALLLRGVIHDKREPAPALALVERAVAVDPTDASGWYNLAVLEAERRNLEAAVAAYERAVAIDPLHADALNNGCELHRRLERFDIGLAWADRRLAMGFQVWSSQLNRAICLFHLNRWQQANEAYDRARELAPEQPIVHWERFPLMLFERRFAEAWDAFEHRFAAGHLNGVFHYPFPQPLWTGQSLKGKHVLIHNEQGLGDQLMFACAVEEAIAKAKRATIVVAPVLVSLFKASFPKAEVLPARFGAFAGDHPEPGWLKDLPPVDYQVPIGSLMALLRGASDSFDRVDPYLRPSDEARKRWAEYDAGPGLKVGVCWASNPALFRLDSARRATRKSIDLQTLSPLGAVKEVSLVSVLNWPIEEMPKPLAGKLIDLSRRLTSMDETAALIETLDLVITVDTAVAHLAGAMGKETWLLLHDFPDCRWEMSSQTSYWYRDMRLFRQKTLGDWGPVIAEVAAALTTRAAQKVNS